MTAGESRTHVHAENERLFHRKHSIHAHHPSAVRRSSVQRTPPRHRPRSFLRARPRGRCETTVRAAMSRAPPRAPKRARTPPPWEGGTGESVAVGVGGAARPSPTLRCSETRRRVSSSRPLSRAALGAGRGAMLGRRREGSGDDGYRANVAKGGGSLLLVSSSRFSALALLETLAGIRTIFVSRRRFFGCARSKVPSNARRRARCQPELRAGQFLRSRRLPLAVAASPSLEARRVGIGSQVNIALSFTGLPPLGAGRSHPSLTSRHCI